MIPNLASNVLFNIHIPPEDKIVLRHGKGRKQEVNFVIINWGKHSNIYTSRS